MFSFFLLYSKLIAFQMFLSSDTDNFCCESGSDKTMSDSSFNSHGVSGSTLILFSVYSSSSNDISGSITSDPLIALGRGSSSETPGSLSCNHLAYLYSIL